MIGRFTFFCALLVPLTLLSPFTRPAPQNVGVNYETMRKDLETMRRLLTRDDSGNRSLSYYGDVASTYTYLGDTGTSDAVYVAGVGPLFLLRSNVLLAPGEPQEQAAEVKEPSAWDEVRAEVDGRPMTRRFRGAGYDAASVEKLKTSILTALAKYGSKIGQVPEDQRLTVVVRSTMNPVRLRTGGRPAKGETKGEKGETAADTEPQTTVSDTFGSYTVQSLGTLFSSSALRSVLTISVRQGDCAAAAEGKLDMDAFMKKAQIAQY